jgi:protein involved in polysaccharide export with SLBB domain
LFTVVLLAACSSSGLSPRQQNAARFAPWSDEPIPYRFEDGDEIDIRLMYNPEFSDRVQVSPDGTIQLQLVGSVKAADKTPDELAADLRERFSKDLRRPDVSVVPRSFASQVVYVGGEVQRQGAIPLRGNADILQVILQAGGFTPNAYKNGVIVIRRSRENTPMLRTVNVRRLIEGDFKQDVQMRRYDVIYVPRTKITDFDQWVDQWINQAIPFSKGFSYAYSNGSTIQRTIGP